MPTLRTLLGNTWVSVVTSGVKLVFLIHGVYSRVCLTGTGYGKTVGICLLGWITVSGLTLKQFGNIAGSVSTRKSIVIGHRTSQWAYSHENYPVRHVSSNTV